MLQTIQTHNQRFDEGKETYSLAINKFSDIDPAEFHRTHAGAELDPSLHNATSNFQPSNINPPQAAPATFDWRNYRNVVTPVKDQGQCGSCWAFSAIGAIESQLGKMGYGEYDLSEQELVDCYQQNCNGQDQRNAWNWLKNNGGAQSESSYPYRSTDGRSRSCAKANGQTVIGVKGYQEIRMPTSDEALKNYLIQNGPLGVGVDCNNWSQSYSRGIMSCGNTPMNHLVLLVGYGSNFWIVKNSWSTSWGQSGFGFIAMGSNRDCGITKWVAAYPLL